MSPSSQQLSSMAAPCRVKIQKKNKKKIENKLLSVLTQRRQCLPPLSHLPSLPPPHSNYQTDPTLPGTTMITTSHTTVTTTPLTTVTTVTTRRSVTMTTLTPSTTHTYLKTTWASSVMWPTRHVVMATQGALTRWPRDNMRSIQRSSHRSTTRWKQCWLPSVYVCLSVCLSTICVYHICQPVCILCVCLSILYVYIHLSVCLSV